MTSLLKSGHALALFVILPAAAQAKLQIVTSTIAKADVGVVYVAHFDAHGGDEATRTWTITCLPRDLIFTSGVRAKITGVPREAGSFFLDLRVADGNGEVDEVRLLLRVRGDSGGSGGSDDATGTGGSCGSSPAGGSGGAAGSMNGGADSSTPPSPQAVRDSYGCSSQGSPVLLSLLALFVLLRIPRSGRSR